MKKLLLILFLIPNLLLAKVQCEDMQQPPQEFMGMELFYFHKYDDPKLGVSANYRMKSVGNSSLFKYGSFTVFKWDYDLEEIDEEIVMEFKDLAIKDIKNAAKTKRPNLKFIDSHDISHVNISPVLQNTYMFETNEEWVEFLSIGTDGSCLYKVRYSTRNQRDSIQRFVDLARAIEDKTKY
jgi:hypothetical protein